MAPCELNILVDELLSIYETSNFDSFDTDIPVIEKQTFKPVMQIGKSHPSIFKKKKEVYYIIARRRIA